MSIYLFIYIHLLDCHDTAGIKLLSYTQPEHSCSRCSCVSWLPSSQYLQFKLGQDLLLFTFTPLMDLALSLIQILLFGRDMYFRQVLSMVSSDHLSPTLALALISSVSSCLLIVAIACLISPMLTKLDKMSGIPIISVISLTTFRKVVHTGGMLLA